jgi:Tol biopolymer transport system component
MDIAEVKKRFGDRIIPVGNLDMNIIANGTTNDIRNSVTELFKTVGYDGRWIMSSSNSIDRGANVENLYTIGKTLRGLHH